MIMTFLIPNKELLWAQYLDTNGNPTHAITSDAHRDTYKLYKIEGNNLFYTKHKSSNPTDLEKWIWSK